jgi:hypothetical protein
MASKPNPIVFVPGIMGTELALAGDAVWASDIRGARTILNPSYLLPWMKLEAGPPVSQYDRLVNFLRKKGYRDGIDLFLFGYDWRVGIGAAAVKLSQFVDNVVRRQQGNRIIFLAHSLGSLVVRWAVVKNLLISHKAELVVAAGPPWLGSARVFRSLLELPDLHPMFGRLMWLVGRLWPGFAGRLEISLTRTLQVVTSLLEILPPREIPVFNSLADPQQLSSAFDWPGWGTELAALRGHVEQAQATLRVTPWPEGLPRKLILSGAHPTETGYFVDAAEPYGIIATWPTADGDGRVLIDAAREFGSEQPELLVDSSHDSLFDDPATLNWLAQRL